MELEERIIRLAKWGEALKNEVDIDEGKLAQARELAFHHNGWFDKENIDQALKGICFMLEEEKLRTWIDRYELEDGGAKRVGIIMAGNLPLVGMHDLVSVLMTGNRAVVKLSSEDDVLLPAALDVLKDVSEELYSMVEMVEGKLPSTEVVLATGSNNTARYFEQYFKEIPHVIRKGRNGLAVIDGSESDEELKEFGKDLFQFYGLGCRNVSKVLLPEDFDVQRIFGSMVDYAAVIDHKKYANNYNYNRTIYLMNEDKFLDNGFLMLKADPAIASPVATLHYQTYSGQDELLDLIEGHKNDIQCIVGHGNVPFGKSQLPEPWDYADGVDTVEFLAGL